MSLIPIDVSGELIRRLFASDLTREHLRKVVRLFIAVQPGQHLVPFGRLGTGSINLMVFAPLTFIAELKDKQSVIFAMEVGDRAAAASAAPRDAVCAGGDGTMPRGPRHSRYIRGVDGNTRA